MRNWYDFVQFYSRAAKLGSLPVMLLAKANSANLNWQNPKDSMKTPLMQAATGASSVTLVWFCFLRHFDLESD